MLRELCRRCGAGCCRNITEWRIVRPSSSEICDPNPPVLSSTLQQHFALSGRVCRCLNVSCTSSTVACSLLTPYTTIWPAFRIWISSVYALRRRTWNTFSSSLIFLSVRAVASFNRDHAPIFTFSIFFALMLSCHLYRRFTLYILSPNLLPHGHECGSIVLLLVTHRASIQEIFLRVGDFNMPEMRVSSCSVHMFQWIAVL